jgi:hypothetical protein
MRRIEVPCTVDIEQTPESLHAHVVPEGVDIQPGDRVLVHGAPSRIGYGERVHLRCSATVIKATAFGRLWTQFTGLLEFAALYEVGFERREAP